MKEPPVESDTPIWMLIAAIVALVAFASWAVSFGNPTDPPEPDLLVPIERTP